MKRTIRTPYFEIGTKNYIWGDKVLEYAQAADRAAEKYDIDVLFITTPVELRRVVENTRHLIVLAPYMDTLQPGRGMADILPEALKDAGAAGVVVNHCEKPMSLPQIKKTIDRAHGLDMLVFACADTVAEAKAIAELHPDIINPEPSELIGGSGGAVSGIAADIATGGATLGLGALGGAIVGALGGAGAAAAYNVQKGHKENIITWSPASMEGFLLDTVLLYLAVAHFGRGRGQWEDSESPAFWKTLAEQAIKAQNIDFKALKEKAADADQLRGEYTKILDKTLRDIFKSLYGVTI